ncbi:hypothetical protein LCGC14_0364360 [marine sediment metagenome]|uniref:DUF4326 domain-containing protein n=1 Tax=marine sediment metagenome TaxID=412755 RepID=A0A0F9T7A1_9ZZZZ
MVTRVVHCKREAYDILIDRSTEMGNPFRIGRDGTRKEVIAKYREWAPKQPWFQLALKRIRGKIIGCWCAPRPCHGDILAEFADMEADQW